MFVFMANGDSQTRQQQTVERLYLDWYVSGGYLIEAQRAEAEKEFNKLLVERERKQKMIDAINLSANLDQKLYFFHTRLVEFNQGLYGKLKAETEQSVIIPVSELNEKNQRLWELEKRERGKELETLAKEIHDLAKKVADKSR